MLLRTVITVVGPYFNLSLTENGDQPRMHFCSLQTKLLIENDTDTESNKRPTDCLLVLLFFVIVPRNKDAVLSSCVVKIICVFLTNSTRGLITTIIDKFFVEKLINV